MNRKTAKITIRNERIIKLLISIFWIFSFCSCVYGHYEKYHNVQKQHKQGGYQKDRDDEEYKHKEPTARTQVNEQTDLFEKSVGNWGEFQNVLNSKKITPSEEKAGELGFVDEKGIEAARSHANSLSSIKASELQGRGRAKFEEFRSSFGEKEDIYVDYSKPLHKKHFRDAKKIADGQDALLGGLLGKLKELGVDCKTEKGPKVLEPEFYLQIEKEEHKDTIYNKTLCEELRGTYNCHDTMSMRCEIRGWTDHPWQEKEREFKFTLGEIAERGWHKPFRWKRKRRGVHFKGGAGLREEIARRLGVHPGHIHKGVRASWRGSGEPDTYLGPGLPAWSVYSAWYKYRDGHEICKKWSEERWDESCSQKR